MKLNCWAHETNFNWAPWVLQTLVFDHLGSECIEVLQMCVKDQDMLTGDIVYKGGLVHVVASEEGMYPTGQ